MVPCRDSLEETWEAAATLFAGWSLVLLRTYSPLHQPLSVLIKRKSQG